MPDPNDVAEFDSLIAEIMSGGDTAVKEVSTEPTVCETPAQAREVVVEALIETPIPSQPVAATETPKGYRVDSDKVSVDGAPFQSTVYSLGYVKAKWPNFRFDNKAAWYLEELEALEAFMASPDYQTWKSACLAAGLRKRGSKREG